MIVRELKEMQQSKTDQRIYITYSISKCDRNTCKMLNGVELSIYDLCCQIFTHLACKWCLSLKGVCVTWWMKKKMKKKREQKKQLGGYRSCTYMFATPPCPLPSSFSQTLNSVTEKSKPNIKLPLNVNFQHKPINQSSNTKSNIHVPCSAVHQTLPNRTVCLYTYWCHT